MLGLCHLAGPEAESRGEVYSAANDRAQAARIFQEMAAIIERVPWLEERVSIKRFTKECEDVGGTESIYAWRYPARAAPRWAWRQAWLSMTS